MSSPDYFSLADALRSADALSEAAEAHGTLAGMVAANPDQDCHHRWLMLSLHGSDQAAHSTPTLTDEARKTLHAVYHSTCAGLSDLQMSFTPLLPPDDFPLGEQARALGLWCQGFVYGFALGRPGTREVHSPQVREVLDDLGRMAEVEIPEDDGDEQDRAALVELVEYVRVAAQLVHDELRLSASGPGDAPTH